MVHEIPQEHLAIITTRGELPASGWRPFHAIKSATVASQLQKRLSWLSGIEYADNIRILRERCE